MLNLASYSLELCVHYFTPVIVADTKPVFSIDQTFMLGFVPECRARKNSSSAGIRGLP